MFKSYRLIKKECKTQDFQTSHILSSYDQIMLRIHIIMNGLFGTYVVFFAFLTNHKILNDISDEKKRINKNIKKVKNILDYFIFHQKGS